MRNPFMAAAAALMAITQAAVAGGSQDAPKLVPNRGGGGYHGRHRSARFVAQDKRAMRRCS